MADELVLPEPLVVDALEDVSDVWANLVAIRDKINGQIAAGNLADGAVGPDKITSALADLIGGGPGGNRRGIAANPTQQTITSTTYASMPTPDRVSQIVVPADGILSVGFMAMVYESVASAARIAIHVNGVQLRAPDTVAGSVVQEAPIGSAARWSLCYSPYWGLRTFVPTTGLTGLPTTPVVLAQSAVSGSGGFWVPIIMTPGTYDVEVKYKVSSGTLYAKERRLWVQTHYPR